MSSDHALRIKQLKSFTTFFDHPHDPLLQAFWGSRRKLYRPFWALQNVSFELARGRTLGVMSRNASEKSTLVQLICCTLTPIEGSVLIKAQIRALLELGSGFNPEFSGLKSIYLNGTLLGLTRKEIDSRLANQGITHCTCSELITQTK